MGSKATPPYMPDSTSPPLTQTGGLRRNDGSLVPVPEGMTPTITPMPTVPRKDPRTTPLAQNEFGFNKRFANQEAFDSAYQNYLETYKDDYSQYGRGSGRRIVEPPTRPLMGVSQDIRRRGPIGPSNFSGEKIIPTMEEFGATANLLPGVSLEEAYNNFFGPLAIQSPDSTAGIMAGLPQVPTPPGMPDNVFVGNATLGGPSPQLPLRPGMGPGGVTLRPGGGVVPRPPGPGSNAINQAQEQFGQYGFGEDVMNFLAGNIQKGYLDMGMNIGYNPETEMFSVGSGGMRPGPTTNYTLDQFTNQFIGSPALSTGTPQPINQPPMSPGEIINPIKNPAPIQTPIGVPQPTNPVTGNTSPIGGSQQDFDAYISGYVNDLINQRMKNVFGGIMSSFS